MPTNYPYISSSGPIVSIIRHLRNSFPSPIDAGVIKKLGLAPKNESYLINIIRFIGLIDEKGEKVDAAAKGFSVHEDAAFQKHLASLVEKAYVELFKLHGKEAWRLPTGTLITFFRQSADSSGIVGQRQANTFQTLAGLCGNAELPKTKEPSHGAPAANTRPAGKTSRKKESREGTGERAMQLNSQGLTNPQGAPFGLTVRVEINLPADGTPETYNSIFQSIRKNLLDGK